MRNPYKIERILVPLDGSEYGLRALAWARAIAGEKATLLLLEITPVADEVRDFRGNVIGTRDEIAERYRDLATKQLESARDTYLSNNENVELLVSEGDPTEQIIWNADEHDADLIVMSSHGRGTIGRFASGSVADRVMRHAPLPVTVVGPDTPSDENSEVLRIVAPVDESELSRTSLPVTAALAQLTDSEAFVVNVVSRSVTTFPAPQFDTMPVPEDVYKAYFEHDTDQSNKLVESSVQSLEATGTTGSGTSLQGSVVNQIEDVASPGDLIVIASHGRSGLPRWVLGSNAMKLVRSAKAPVTVVTREFLERAEEST